MTLFLASVTGPDEAEAALAGGADVIDLKDPSQGALGAVSVEVLLETIGCVAGRRPVSAVAGDLAMELAPIRAAIEARSAADFVKIGLFPAEAEIRRAIIAGLSDLTVKTKLIAVLFADGDFDPALLADLAAAGFHGAMIDTIGKTGDAGGPSGLLKHLTIAELGHFVEACRGFGLVSGLAGSLEAPDVPRLSVLHPDYLGFRGALTGAGRGDPIDAAAVAAIRALLPTGEAVAPAGDLGTDRIFVRDFTLDMEIGAYGFERGRRQKVRFSVEVDVARLSAHPLGMADIYSYDLIMDAIRTLVARGHTDLVETLAEELAATILGDRRIEAATVRVEKLELGPAAVGIEIRRRRPG